MGAHKRLVESDELLVAELGVRAERRVRVLQLVESRECHGLGSLRPLLDGLLLRCLEFAHELRLAVSQAPDLGLPPHGLVRVVSERLLEPNRLERLVLKTLFEELDLVRREGAPDLLVREGLDRSRVAWSMWRARRCVEEARDLRGEGCAQRILIGLWKGTRDQRASRDWARWARRGLRLRCDRGWDWGGGSGTRGSQSSLERSCAILNRLHVKVEVEGRDAQPNFRARFGPRASRLLER